MAQIGHRELTDAVHVGHVARGREAAVVCGDGFLSQKISRNVGDVVAVVGLLGPLCIARLQAPQTRKHRLGERGNLHTGVVVIKLTRDLRALGFKQIANAVAQRRLARMPQVQRAGRVGRDKLNQHFGLRRRLVAKLCRAAEHFTDHRLLGRRIQAQVDKARPGNFHGRHQTLHRALAAERIDQRLRHLAGIFAQRLGQLHGGSASQVAMRGHARRLERRCQRAASADFFDGGTQGPKQILFRLNHLCILSGGP